MARIQLQYQRFAWEDLLEIAPSYDACLYCLSPETAYLAVALLERFPDWRARWFHTDGEQISDAEWDAIQNIVARGIGELMGCSELGTSLENGLNAIAAALRAGAGGSGNCYPGTIGDCLTGVPNEDWSPPVVPDQPDEETDPPPDGFESWEQYFVWKCSAAVYIWQQLKNLCYALGGLAGLQLTSAIVVPIVAGFAGVLPAALTPIGFVALVGAIIAIGAISIIGIGAAAHMGNYLDDNREDIVCALYESGSAADALSALAGFIEDAIEAGVLAAGLGEVTAPLVAAGLGEVFSLVQTTGLVQPLFQLVADVTMPEVECPCEDTGTLLKTAPGIPFDDMIVGTLSHGAHDEDGFYPSDGYVEFNLVMALNCSSARVVLDVFKLTSGPQVASYGFDGLASHAITGVQDDWDRIDEIVSFDGQIGQSRELRVTAEFEQSFIIRRIAVYGIA